MYYNLIMIIIITFLPNMYIYYNQILILCRYVLHFLNTDDLFHEYLLQYR